MLIRSFRAITFIHHKRTITTSALGRLVQRPVQAYISTTKDPFLNLAIENHLLKTSTPDSAILYVYVNRPSIVIGRNQNPWLEVNLPLLVNGSIPVELLRRRSGGGTVFHDEGNVNWTVIINPTLFTRDKHVDMIVRALHDCGVESTAGNARHDIVIHQGDEIRKVSGSAYKLTKHRALHHGTCLLSSPNLAHISKYLRSPGKQYITAKGVESVSSPISNLGLKNDDFIEATLRQFSDMYGSEAYKELGEDCLEVDSIQQEVSETKSSSWKFLQTPQFAIKSRQKSSTGQPMLEISVRHGLIEAIMMNDQTGNRIVLRDGLLGQPLHTISNWLTALEIQGVQQDQPDLHALATWLQETFPCVEI